MSAEQITILEDEQPAGGLIIETTRKLSETMVVSAGDAYGLVRRLAHDIAAAFEVLDPADTRVLAGFAGAGTADSQDLIRSILIEAGFRRATVTSDVGLLLMALRNDGVVLSAGTGATSQPVCSRSTEETSSSCGTRSLGR